MQKSKIKVGEHYRVEIDGLSEPQDFKIWSDEVVKFEHGFTYRGVSKTYGKKVEAVVKALDQPRPERVGYRHSSFKNDGVLVEFVEVQNVGYYGEQKPVKTAVLSTKHIIQPWDEYAAACKARDEAVVRMKLENTAKAEKFRNEVERVMVAMKAMGFLNVSMYADESGVHFTGGSLGCATAECSDDKRHAVGWSHKSHLDTRKFVAMLLGDA